MSDRDRVTGVAAAKGGIPPLARGTERDQRWGDYICRIRERDEAALAALYDESSTLLYSMALRMTGNAADAEEILSDVYSHVWCRAATWDPNRGNASAWLVMLCRSRCVDRVRSRRSRASVEHSFTAEAACHGLETVEHDMVRQALDRIEPAQRHLLELAFFSGLTHTELAEELSLPLGTVKTRIRTAMMRLRDLLKESGK